MHINIQLKLNVSNVLLLLSLLLILTAITSVSAVIHYPPSNELKRLLRDDVKRMFYHGYDSYMKHSFPMDELKPISCKGSDTFGKYALTYIDSLDALLILGNTTEFEKGVQWTIDNIQFNKDVNVSVFETNIRVLGGLLSAHLLAEEHMSTYTGGLLPLALDLGERILVAFDTPTGIPYGAVNLARGVLPGESSVTCTAGAGTFALEFGILSKLTQRPEFERAAKRAARSLWRYRSEIDLLGNHLDLITGAWTITESGIGTGIDSYFEYLLKAAIFFDDQDYLDIFEKAYRAIIRHVKKEHWYVEVQMSKANIVWPIYNSLQSFWPGLQALAGQFEDAFGTVKAFHTVWRRYGFLPEGYNLLSGGVHPGQRSYPLRPELAESLYTMYQNNKDPYFIKMGRDMVWTLSNQTRCECGHANIADVETHELEDKMESFFLSETCKYLYLLFDDSNMFINQSYVFNTEGHIFPMQYRFIAKDSLTTSNIRTKYDVPI
ncbi:hypothetical protein SAMD00019534_090900 [Acytostelium subglobosum LB1]|uniref:hypothetical protein n=1 Tax=Acytostelium subglobosum LB1 TaxID=1410327 RepID=UPI00064512D0|nr:hypothetical protein SAMD00019534_090900 [Acytostelium subglobosum LB1]GAM25915.1 hypothetical protein SAMD00019534_090900 [Acytostelium subglobosum LB1]|eukprot:XP_012750958.1 hypothetical protein SAMD00019534_090900 [Acytostelium subglobosum LB1]